MKRGWVRYGALGLGGAVLSGLMLLPATGVMAATPGAGAGAAQVVKGGDTGRPDPCAPGRKPTTKPSGKPTGQPSGKPSTKPTDEPSGKPTGKGGSARAVLVCGDIAKLSGRGGTTVLVIKTAKGPVTVLVPPGTPVWKGDVRVPGNVLRVGQSVLIKTVPVDGSALRAVSILLR